MCSGSAARCTARATHHGWLAAAARRGSLCGRQAGKVQGEARAKKRQGTAPAATQHTHTHTRTQAATAGCVGGARRPRQSLQFPTLLRGLCRLCTVCSGLQRFPRARRDIAWAATVRLRAKAPHNSPTKKCALERRSFGGGVAAFPALPTPTECLWGGATSARSSCTARATQILPRAAGLGDEPHSADTTNQQQWRRLAGRRRILQ